MCGAWQGAGGSVVRPCARRGISEPVRGRRCHLTNDRRWREAVPLRRGDGGCASKLAAPLGGVQTEEEVDGDVVRVEGVHLLTGGLDPSTRGIRKV